jgi:hypothetical protein
MDTAEETNKALEFIKGKHNGEIPYTFGYVEYGFWMAEYLKSFKDDLMAKIEDDVSSEKHVIENPSDYDYRDVESARHIYNTAKRIKSFLDSEPKKKEE